MAIQPISFGNTNINFDPNPFLTSYLKNADLFSTYANTALTNNQNKWYDKNAEADIKDKLARALLDTSSAGVNNKQIQWYDKNAEADIKDKLARALLDTSSAGLNNKQIKWFDQSKKTDLENTRQDIMKKMIDNYNDKVTANLFADKFGISPPNFGGQSLSGTQQKVPYTNQLQNFSQNQSQPVSQNPNNNSSSSLYQDYEYGVKPIEMTRDDYINRRLGIDTLSPKIKAMESDRENEKKNYSSIIDSSAQAADESREFLQNLDLFNEAMDKATFKGPKLSKIPFSSMGKYEQDADIYAQRMLPQAMQQIRKAMGNGRFSIIDMQNAELLNFNRHMNDDLRKKLTNTSKGIAQRMQELPVFMQDLSKRTDHKTAELMWQNYQNNMPVTTNKNNLDKWMFYTTPKALEELQNNHYYSPPRTKNGSYYMRDNKTGNVIPISEDKVSEAYKKGLVSPL